MMIHIGGENAGCNTFVIFMGDAVEIHIGADNGGQAAVHPCVDDIIDGIRAMPVTSKNGKTFVFVTPTKYVIKSFGVPGIK